MNTEETAFPPNPELLNRLPDWFKARDIYSLSVLSNVPVLSNEAIDEGSS